MNKYISIARINLLNSLVYAGEFGYRSIFMAVILYIFIQLWKTTYNSVGTSSIEGITFIDTIWYLVITETIMLSKASFSGRVSQEVKDGSIAYTMGKPYNYILYHFANGAGDTVVRMIINFVFGSILVTIFAGPMPFKIINTIPMLLCIFMAFTLDFLIEGIIGLCAFITEDVSSIQLIYAKTLFILGGMLIPIDFFPVWLKKIAMVIPCNYIIYAPARLFISFNIKTFLNILTMQTLWAIVFALLLMVLFRMGIRHIAINGG